MKSRATEIKINLIFFQVTSKYDTNRRASTLHWNNFHLSWKLPRTSLLLLWHALWLAQNTGAFLNQSDLKLEPTMTWPLAFSRAFDNSTLFSSLMAVVSTLYTQRSVCTFSTLFFIHFLRCWQGEFVCQSKGSFPGDHFPLFSWP